MLSTLIAKLPLPDDIIKQSIMPFLKRRTFKKYPDYASYGISVFSQTDDSKAAFGDCKKYYRVDDAEQLPDDYFNSEQPPDEFSLFNSYGICNHCFTEGRYLNVKKHSIFISNTELDTRNLSFHMPQVFPLVVNNLILINVSIGRGSFSDYIFSNIIINRCSFTYIRFWNCIFTGDCEFTNIRSQGSKPCITFWFCKFKKPTVLRNSRYIDYVLVDTEVCSS